MSSKTDIYIKDMELTEELREYIEKKSDKLDKFLNNIDEKRVDLAFVKTAREPDNKFVAQVTLRGRGFILRAEERAVDIKAAIDQVLDKIERQIADHPSNSQQKQPGNDVHFLTCGGIKHRQKDEEKQGRGSQIALPDEEHHAEPPHDQHRSQMRQGRQFPAPDFETRRDDDLAFIREIACHEDNKQQLQNF